MMAAISNQLAGALGARHRGTMHVATYEPLVDTSRLRYDYEQIDEAHRAQVMQAAVQIKANADRVRDSIFAIGNRLLEVKDYLPHGHFGEWLRVEFDLSERMAQNMMNVAREYGDKSETVSLLSDSVLYLLAAPSTPAEAREAVEQQVAATGKSPTRAEVKRVIKQHRPAPEPPPARVVYVEPEPVEPTPEQAKWQAEVEADLATANVAHLTPDDLFDAGYMIVGNPLGAPEGETYRWLHADGEVGDWWTLDAAIADARKRVALEPAQPPAGNPLGAPAPTPLEAAIDEATREQDEPYGMFDREWVMDALINTDPINADFATALNQLATRDDLREALASLSTENKHHKTRQAHLQARLRALAAQEASEAIGKPLGAPVEKMENRGEEIGNSSAASALSPISSQPISSSPISSPLHPIVELMISPTVITTSDLPNSLHWAVRQATVEQLQEALRLLPDELRAGRGPVLQARLKALGVALEQRAQRAPEAATPAVEQSRFEAWIKAMPPIEGLYECRLLVELGLLGAQETRRMENRLRLRVEDAIRPLHILVKNLNAVLTEKKP